MVEGITVDEILNRQQLKEFLNLRALRLKLLIGKGLPHIQIVGSGRVTYLFLKSSIIEWLRTLELPKQEPKKLV